MIEQIEWIACAERPVRRPVDGDLLALRMHGIQSRHEDSTMITGQIEQEIQAKGLTAPRVTPAAPQAEPKREPLTDEQIEAQIEARDALLDFISENGTASEGVQHYLDRYVRAALAAKDEK